jgi:hypothetical protein
LRRRIDSIYDLVLDLFGIAEPRGAPPLTAANDRAEAVLDTAAS